MRRDKQKQAEDEDFEWEYYDELDPEDLENWDEAELTEEQKKDTKSVTPFWSKKNKNRTDLEPLSDHHDDDFKISSVSDTAFVKAAMELRAEEEAKKPKEIKKPTAEEIDIANMPNLSRKVIFDISKEAEEHGSLVGEITHLAPNRHKIFPDNH